MIHTYHPALSDYRIYTNSIHNSAHMSLNTALRTFPEAYQPWKSDADVCDAVLLVYALKDACNNFVGSNFVTSLKAFA